MITSTILGLLIPFIGTSLGAACVLFMKNELSVKTTKMLSGFAAGVMIAASVWSLLIPALEQSQSLGKMQFVPAVAGFMLGMFFLLILDTITPHMHLCRGNPRDRYQGHRPPCPICKGWKNRTLRRSRSRKNSPHPGAHQQYRNRARRLLNLYRSRRAFQRGK